MNYKRTMRACYLGYISSAIANNFAPLLFAAFNREFSISLEQIGLLVTVNFGIQLLVDLLGAKYIDKIGYKKSVVMAQLFIAAGLVGLGILPYIMPGHYSGLLLSVFIYAIGSGLNEVLISAITEAVPGEGKAKSMSLIHSFYCWGHVLVVLVSTLFFSVCGISNWRYLAFAWAVLPLITSVLFTRVPVMELKNDDEKISVKGLFKIKLFWLFLILMICSGAAEQAMSQWASMFAENGLNVSKATGDLLGPCLFAVMMGISRIFYGKYGHRISLQKFIICSSALCVISYAVVVYSPYPVLSLVGCGLCGLSVGIMWPGVLSMSAGVFRGGATSMFALLALAGDIGCFTGPQLVSIFAGADGDIRKGLLSACIFPALMLVSVIILRIYKSRHKTGKEND